MLNRFLIGDRCRKQRRKRDSHRQNKPGTEIVHHRRSRGEEA